MVPDLPARPKFSWDFRHVPWADGKGDQEPYKNAVLLWKAFHDKLPDTNSYKVPQDLQGIMLQSQLYGRALDLSKKIPTATLQSPEGVSAIISAVYRRDRLVVVSNVYQLFQDMLSTKRGTSESFQNFESRFEAKVSKFNSQSENLKLPEALVTFVLLANCNLDGSQRVSILAAAAPYHEELSPDATNEEFLSSIRYDALASVVRQCDKPRTGMPSDIAPRGIQAHTASVPSRKSRSRRRLSPEELADLKSKSTCRKCGAKDHWEVDHGSDGTFVPKKQHNGDEKTTGPVKMGKTVSFNMVRIFGQTEAFEDLPGPLLDDAAPYSDLGEKEFRMLAPYLLPAWNELYEPLPPDLADFPYCQYGSGEHASAARKMLGSVVLSATTNQGTIVNIRHLVIEGSSQWVVGRNVSRHCNIDHIYRNALILPASLESYISLVDHGFHSYIPFEAFGPTDTKLTDPAAFGRVFCATLHVHSASQATRPWSELKPIVDKVHRHVCGHSNYQDIKTLLQRNNIWNNDVRKYLYAVLHRCTACITVQEPKASRLVSLSAMSRQFNQVVCIDHLFLNRHKVFHCMDSVSRCSAGFPVTDTTMSNAITAFEAHWITLFWPPDTVLYDPAFDNSEFTAYLHSLGINASPIPPRRHKNNVLESKHKIIRDIFL